MLHCRHISNGNPKKAEVRFTTELCVEPCKFPSMLVQVSGRSKQYCTQTLEFSKLLPQRISTNKCTFSFCFGHSSKSSPTLRAFSFKLCSFTLNSIVTTDRRPHISNLYFIQNVVLFQQQFRGYVIRQVLDVILERFQFVPVYFQEIRFYPVEVRC